MKPAPLIERIVHVLARFIAGDLWRLRDAIRVLNRLLDRAGDRLTDAGHDLLQRACDWSRRRYGQDRER